MGQGGDAWWELCESSDVSGVGAEVAEALTTNGLPTLNRLGSDGALRGEWSAGRSPGITELQRLQYLTILLNEPGLRGEQAAVVEQLKELGRRKGLMGAVSVHLEQLGVE